MAQNTTGKRAKPDTTGIFGGCDNDVDREGNNQLGYALMNIRQDLKQWKSLITTRNGDVIYGGKRVVI